MGVQLKHVYDKYDIVDVPVYSLDATQTQTVGGFLASTFDYTRPTILNLIAVKFIDSSGLGLIIVQSRKFTDGGKMIITGINKPVAALFKVTALARALTICDTMEAAVAAAGG